MAKQSGLGDNFYVGGADLSGDVASVDTISGVRDVIDDTAIKELAHDRLYGLKGGTMSFTTFFENAPAIATPGFPASNTPVVNTNTVPVYVTITGGTLTNVSINGSTVGSTAGTYGPVPVGGNISITYTVAPSWNWFALPAEHNALSPLPRTDTIGSYFRGAAIGNAAACMNSKQVNYDFTRDNTGNLTGKVDLTPNSFGLEWGLQLTAGIRTDTAAVNGAALDNGAGTAFGAQAYLQLFTLVGTNVDVVVQHSVDNVTWATLIDFGSQTVAVSSFRGSVSNVTTVNRYLRAITTGTFTYTQIAVAVMRNPIAGIVF